MKMVTDSLLWVNDLDKMRCSFYKLVKVFMLIAEFRIFGLASTESCPQNPKLSLIHKLPCFKGF